jgi:hypothetical protein
VRGPRLAIAVVEPILCSLATGALLRIDVDAARMNNGGPESSSRWFRGRSIGIIAFGSAGLGTAFVVAAVCQLWGEWTISEKMVPSQTDERVWIAHHGESAPRCHGVIVHSKLGAESRGLFYGERNRNTHLLFWVRAGLPFRGFEGFGHYLLGAKSEIGFLNVGQLPRATARGIPIRPIWTGLVANTLVFGFAWYALFRGPGTIRRAMRRRAGRCEACGYPVQSQGPCPECGLPAPAGPRGE